jgi:hypothetical protein
MIDALAYANTSNLLDINDIQSLPINFPTGSSAVDQVKKYLDSTTIKRACCMGRAGAYNIDGTKGVNVKIPIPTGYNVSGDPNATTKNQFGYIEKTIYIPESMCEAQWKKYTPYCDNFMSSYCTNQYKGFQQMLGDHKDDGGIWSAYLKDCSCFAPPDNKFGSAPKNCYMYGCKAGDSDVYLSGDSRDSNGNPLQCNLTICSSIINASDITAGGSANFNPTVRQQCGQQIDEAQQQAATRAAAQQQADARAAAQALAKPTVPSTPRTDTKPSSPTDTKPSSPTDTKPSSPTNATPSSPTATTPSSPTATTPSSPTATTPSTPKDKQQSGSTTTWVIVFVLLCLFLLSAIGGIVIWKKNKK